MIQDDWSHVSSSLREQFPNNCPVIIHDGDGKSVGPCWRYMYNGKCDVHGTPPWNTTVSYNDERLNARIKLSDDARSLLPLVFACAVVVIVIAIALLH